MFKKISEIFKETNQQFSSYRVIFVFSIFIIVSVWSYLSIINNKIQNPTWELVSLVSILIGGKVTQKTKEIPTIPILQENFSNPANTEEN